MPHIQTGLLVAGALAAFIGLQAFFVSQPSVDKVADMRIEPVSGTVVAGDTFSIDIVVDSPIPVNVFSGELTFNNNILKIDSIDYNISIADLWAEVPWYSNGDGIMTFAGGTTAKGGFIGAEKLVTVTFRALQEGEGKLIIEEPRILKYDGLGTDASVKEAIEAIYTVEATGLEERNLVVKETAESEVGIVKRPPSTDLNGDGKQTIADVSIFMIHILGDEPEYDFNLDGSVDTKDLSILFSAK